tara:strand:+ start:165 stop:677 length:513 start_codon:yes stop_codon:yes gene_type:complete
MSYFSYFSPLLYDPKGNGNAKLVTNILSRIRVRVNMKKEIVMLDAYDIKENETPEIVADRHHGSPYYHWVVMILNNVSDVYHDWPKATRQLQKYVQTKYTEAQLSEVHHYELAQSSGDTTIKIQVPQGTSGATTVTNYEYEVAKNDAKRSIDLLRNDYLGFFVDEFESLV